MPARRELHTGRHNFLHRSWGPLEPFDNSTPELLKQHGVYTHLASDHQHYWEDGGASYHGRYSTWEFFHGQEGDAWTGQVADPEPPEDLRSNRNDLWRQDWVSRAHMDTEEKHSQTLKDLEVPYVLTCRVVHATDGWLTVKCGVAPVMVVGVQEVLQSFGALGVAGVRAHVRPLVEQGAIQTLDLAVRLRAIRARAFVDDAGGAEGPAEQPGSVAGAVVCEYAFNGDAVAGEEGVGALPEGGGGLLAFVG